MNDGTGCVVCGSPNAIQSCMGCDEVSLQKAATDAERETIARVVAWLRAEARHAEHDDAWNGDQCETLAMRAERGEWKGGE